MTKLGAAALTSGRNTIVIVLGIGAFLALEAYGLYSMRRSFDTRLSQMETGIESLRAADIGMTSAIAALETPKATGTKANIPEGKPKDGRPGSWNEQIARDPKLAEKLQKMLPAGTNLKEAASGFRTEREFILAVHVSKNLNIRFAQLKAKTTGNHAVSMAAAIHDLRPDLSKSKAKSELEKAERLAKETGKLSQPTSRA